MSKPHASVIRQSLLKPPTILGCDRNAVICLVGLDALLAVNIPTWGLSYLWAAGALLLVGGPLIFLWTRNDPHAWRIYVRCLRYHQVHYPSLTPVTRTPQKWSQR